MVEALRPHNPGADTVLPDLTAVAPNRFVDHNTIIYFAGKLAEAAAAKRVANNAFTLVRKQFKNTGVTLGTFDIISSLAELDDPDAIMKFIDEALHIAKAFDVLPPGTQADIFVGAGSVVDAKEKARKAGHIRGVMGNNPDEQAYPPNGDLGQEHLAGWHDGQAIRQAQFLSHNEQERAAQEARAAEKEAKEKKKQEREAKKLAKTDTGDTVQ